MELQKKMKLDIYNTKIREDNLVQVIVHCVDHSSISLEDDSHCTTVCSWEVGEVTKRFKVGRR